MTLVRKRPGGRVFTSAEDQLHLAWSTDVELFTRVGVAVVSPGQTGEEQVPDKKGS